jgi:MFS family permease
MMISSMVTAPVAGVISDRIRSRRKLVLGAWVLAGLAVLIMFNAPPVLLIVSLALLGIAGGMMPVGIFTAATELGRKAEESGAYMSVVVFGQYAGMFFGPVFFSAAAGFAGWAAASFALTVMAAALFVVSLKLDI